MQKITEGFLKMWATLVVGPMYLAIYATAPFKYLIMLSWTTDSVQWALMHCTSCYHCSKNTSVFPRVVSLLNVLTLGVPNLSLAMSVLRR